ncbi:MAG: hypothetical protein Q9171_006695 [Xanthocarpia ochracea]
MSFGCGVGDFILLTKLGWNVYKKCKDSTGSYAELTSDVSSFRSVLQETEELLSEQTLTEMQKSRLLSCQQGCEAVLNDLDNLLARYESLGTSKQRTFDRMRMGHEDVNGIRQRLILNGSLLDSFNSASSFARLERKLSLIVSEVRSGKRKDSVISDKDFEKTAEDDQETWDALRRDLEDIGISQQVIKEQKIFIIDWFRKAAVAEGLEQNTPSSEITFSEITFCENPFSESDSLPSTALPEENIPSQIVMKTEQDSDISGVPAGTRKPSTIVVATWKRLVKALSCVGDSRPQVSALRDAAYAGDDRQIRKLLSKGVDINTLDQSGATALHIAAKQSHLSTVELLLKHGADVKGKAECGWTALHSAAFALGGAFEVVGKIVQLLLDHGADIDAETDLGSTPLALASMKGEKEVISVLLAKGANIEAKNGTGDTPLALASVQRNMATVGVLVENGADLEARTRSRETPLLIATRLGCTELILFLLDNEANIEAKDIDDNTPLIAATKGEDTKIVSLLLERGADLEARGGMGDTALIVAARRGNTTCMSLLLGSGADIEARNDDSETVWTYANASQYQNSGPVP